MSSIPCEVAPESGPTPGSRDASRILRPMSDAELPGCCLWFTGLSGAGKSTIANIVVDELRARGRKVELLDGDEVREHLSKGLGFSKEDRDTNIRRIGWVASVLARNGVVSVTAAISPYRAVRDEVRGWIDNFVEIHVATSLEDCEARDVKGLYAKARAGEIPEFTGVSDPVRAAARIPRSASRPSGRTPGRVGRRSRRLARGATTSPSATRIQASGSGGAPGRRRRASATRDVEGAWPRSRRSPAAVPIDPGRHARGRGLRRTPSALVLAVDAAHDDRRRLARSTPRRACTRRTRARRARRRRR